MEYAITFYIQKLKKNPDQNLTFEFVYFFAKLGGEGDSPNMEEFRVDYEKLKVEREENSETSKNPKNFLTILGTLFKS